MLALVSKLTFRRFRAVVAFGCFIIHVCMPPCDPKGIAKVGLCRPLQFYLELRNVIAGEENETKPRQLSKRTKSLVDINSVFGSCHMLTACQ
jgi:hypothetical protein